MKVPPWPINTALTTVFTAERYFALSVPMPFGISLLAVLDSPHKNTNRAQLSISHRLT
jgi:hypothetical protein